MRKLLLLLSFTLLAAACGDGSDTTADTAPTTTAAPATTAAPTTSAATTTSAAPTTTVAPTTTAAVADGFPVTVANTEIADRPQRIVSMSSTTTEVLFAIGAGDQVVAVDSFSNYPAEAPITDLSAFEPSIEAIASYEPDLVVIFSDPGDVADGLTALDIPVITHVAATTIDDAYTQIEELGAATGNVSGAADLISDMQGQIDEAVAEFAVPDEALTYYHEVDNTYFSATSETFVGSIYSLFGLDNIADPADTEGWGFPQLSPEYIIDADPDVIFYGCAVWCGTTADAIAERPGWDSLTAVQRGALFELDDDVVSRWGPRLVDFVRLIGQSLEQLLVPSS